MGAETRSRILKIPSHIGVWLPVQSNLDQAESTCFWIHIQWMFRVILLSSSSFSELQLLCRLRSRSRSWDLAAAQWLCSSVLIQPSASVSGLHAALFPANNTYKSLLNQRNQRPDRDVNSLRLQTKQLSTLSPRQGLLTTELQTIRRQTHTACSLQTFTKTMLASPERSTLNWAHFQLCLKPLPPRTVLCKHFTHQSRLFLYFSALLLDETQYVLLLMSSFRILSDGVWPLYLDSEMKLMSTLQTMTWWKSPTGLKNLNFHGQNMKKNIRFQSTILYYLTIHYNYSYTM